MNKWLLILAFHVLTAWAINWLSVHKTQSTQWKGLSSCAYGRREHSFDKGQVRTCRRQLEAMPHLTLAAETAVTTCQKLFSSRRWNCSSVLNAPKHSPDLITGTREQAVVHALAAGAVTWALSRACAQGTLFLCHCGSVPHEPPNGNFKWGGCGDNVKFGARFAREFLDTSKGNRNKRNSDRESVSSHKTRSRVSGFSNTHQLQSSSRKLSTRKLSTRKLSTKKLSSSSRISDRRRSRGGSHRSKRRHRRSESNIAHSEGMDIDLSDIRSSSMDDLSSFRSPSSNGATSFISNRRNSLGTNTWDNQATRNNREIIPLPVDVQRKGPKRNKKRKDKKKKNKNNNNNNKSKRKKNKKRINKKDLTSLDLMNHHNNRVGRRVVVESLAKQCKCHGVSGSCNVKTCWRALPNFDEAGSRVYRRYLQGVEVREVNAGLRLHLLPASPAVNKYSRDDLIYITRSPDYCLPQASMGSVGTIGRQCNATSRSQSGCGLMCCGRSYVSRSVLTHHRCHCKYHWCCYVRCKTCSVLQDVHTCN